MDRRGEERSLAFGPEGLAEARRGLGSRPAVGQAEAGQGPQAHPRGLAVGQSLGRVGVGAMLGVRRVRNGWVLDDGRGTELIALTAGDVGALVTQWCVSIQEADREQGGG